MPMAPADPLFLMWCAVNRVTTSGRVAGPDQRVTVEQALRGVTIEAAYSLKLDNEIGTISPGKRANLTVLADNPLTVPSDRIKDIEVWGTVMEGRIFPRDRSTRRADGGGQPGAVGAVSADVPARALRHALYVAHNHSFDRPRVSPGTSKPKE
jgi:predicted amidohydrolase